MSNQNKTFRIFISSTFSDLKAERNALQERVFPRLRQLAEARGCRFQAIDLRWGISEEAALDQQTMKICLGEIQRCQHVSPRPNFLILLGDRYGWRPPPSHIPEDEFSQLLEVIPEKDKAPLKEWYELDRNAVPGEWRLKPRQRGSACEKYEGWQPVEARLQAILSAAAEKLGFTPKQRLPYTASATEQEIAAGALRVKDAPEHVLCFFRSIDGLPQHYDPAARDFLDLDEGSKSLDAAAHRKQEDLKARLAAYVPGNVCTYPARWTGAGITTSHIDALCADVYTALERIILAELEHPHALAPAVEAVVQLKGDSALDEEGRTHKEFAEERLRFFVGRSELLAKIAGHLKNRPRRSLAVAGDGGSGKSALLAKALQQALQAHPSAQVVYRFIGATAGSSDGRSLLEGLCREISRRYDASQSNIPSDYRELVPELSRRMQLARPDRPLIIFLDSLDQLAASHEARSLAWLPAELPEHVAVIVSTRREDTLQALQAKAALVLELGGLSRQEGDELLTQWLASARRTLQVAQRAQVLEGFEQSLGNPLYLKLAFEEARLWLSSQPPEPLAAGVVGIIEKNMFARLAKDGNHGQMLISRALGYLAASRYGLAEDELVDLLSRDLQVYRWFLGNSYHLPADLIPWAGSYLRSQRVKEERTNSHSQGDGTQDVEESAALEWLQETRRQPERLAEFLEAVLPNAGGPRLPVVLWSRLSFDLAPYLSERMLDGSPLLNFYHRELAQAAARAFLANDAAQACHDKLADYFRFKADPQSDKSWSGNSAHGMSELPYHLTRAGRYEDVFQTLTDFKFLEHKAAQVGVLERKDEKGELVKTYTGVLQLQDDYALALAAMQGGEGGAGSRPALILTALETSKGLLVYCPVCNTASPIQREMLDTVIACPQQACKTAIKLNPFTVKREL